jgi:transposase
MRHHASRQVLESAYNQEKDGEVKARTLLVLRVKVDGVRPAHAVKELHRTRPWATKWLRRFQEEGLDGLETKKRSGRPPKIPPRVLMRIRRKLTTHPDGWRVHEVREVIRNESSVSLSMRQVYRLLHNWGFRPVVPERRFLRKASREERLAFKKGPNASWVAYRRASPQYPWTSP